ncbi:MAG TPA: beta-glucuronidase, partial [Verrucomicrobiae bacterium]|nr:beta-glucuronidase [Verrucomicrobiae bacterium]
MKKIFLLLLGSSLFANLPARSETVIADVFARHTTSLNGQWHVIVDPYDTGYYDYRRQPYDEAAKITGGYAPDHQPKDKTELVEYNFDTSPTLNVPGD